MEKISGIIASSPRLQAVDMKDASPVRPGTPLFGRPEGVSSLRAAAAESRTMNVPTTAQKSVGVHMDQMDWRSKDQAKANIVLEMSNRFFMKNTKPAEPVDVTNGAGAYAGGMPVGLHAVESRPTGFKTDELTAPRTSVRPDPVFADETEEETVELQQPEGLYPKGSFIDRTV